jgi:Beta-lactamase
VRSTVRDLLRYARAHLGGGADPPFMPVAALAQMRDPVVATGPLGHVGLSWFLEDRDGVRIASHGGATVAHMSQLVLVSARGVAFTILTNGADGARLYGEVTEWLLTRWLGLPGRERPSPLARQPDPAPYVGRYWAPLSDLTLDAEDGALVLRVAWKGRGRGAADTAARTPRLQRPGHRRRDRGRPAGRRRLHPRLGWRRRVLSLGWAGPPEGRLISGTARTPFRRVAATPCGTAGAYHRSSP